MQLESLLFVTHHLQLEQLNRQVLGVVRGNSFNKNALLWSATSVLASERIVAAAGNTTSASADNLVMQPLVISSGTGRQQLLQPTDRLPAVRFHAAVQQDFLHFKKDEAVLVELNLSYGPVATLRRAGDAPTTTYPLNLLLGTPTAKDSPFNSS